MSTDADRLVLREGYASALYVALVVFSTLVAVPADRLPSDPVVVELLFGVSLGLIVAHRLAFRVAVRLTEGGLWTTSAAREAAAQLVGGLAAAALGALPYLLLDGAAARTTSLVLLAAVPAAAGGAIARQRREPWPRVLLWSAAVFLLAQAAVALKVTLSH
jgi:hypothetical protein